MNNFKIYSYKTGDEAITFVGRDINKPGLQRVIIVVN